MRARTCVGQCDLGDACGGGLGVDGSVLVQDATVAMGGVLAQAHVARDVERGEQRAQLLDGLDDGTLLVVCWSAFAIL